MVYVILNILFSAYLIWIGYKFHSKSNMERGVMCNFFLCASAVCLLNAAVIMVSFFGNLKASSIIGMLMFFMNALLSIYLTLYFVIYPHCKDSLIISIFEVLFVVLAFYLAFMRINSVSVFEESGYLVETDCLLLMKNHEYRDLFYLIYLVFLPLCCINACIFGYIKSSSVQKKQQSLIHLLGILFCSALIILLILFSKTDVKFAMYDTLFTFSYVLFAMVFDKTDRVSNKISRKMFGNWLIQFSCFYLAAGILNGICLALLSTIRNSNQALFYVLYILCSFVVFFAAFFSFIFIQDRKEEQEEFTRYGRKNKYEENLLRFIRYHYDAIDSDRYSMDYSTAEIRDAANDVFDVIKMNRNRYILIFGNVSNNTPETKRSMIFLKAIFRTILLDSANLKEFVKKINKYLLLKIGSESIFKCFVAVLELNENTMYYINCGIPLVATYSKNLKNVKAIQGEPCSLGIDMDISSKLFINKVKLNSDDVVLISNDENATVENILTIDFRNKTMKKSFLQLECK